MITKYVNTIQTMFYFNALKIQRNMHEIIRQTRNFVAFFNKYNSIDLGWRVKASSMGGQSKSTRTLMIISRRM